MAMPGFLAFCMQQKAGNYITGCRRKIRISILLFVGKKFVFPT